MTVTTTLDRQYFDGDGSNKVFPFNFRFFTNDQIYVSLIAPDGTITLQNLTTNYTLSGALQAGGGTVTMIVAPPLTVPATRVFVQRILPQVQPTSIRNQGKFYPEIHEDAFDRLTMLIQQALAGLANALQLTFSKTGWNFLGYKGINLGAPTQPTDAATKDYVDTSSQGNNSYTDGQILRTVRGGAGEVLTQLPPAAARANKVMGFDGAGNPIGTLPATGSGTELAIDLLNPDGIGKGSAIVMNREPGSYTARSVADELNDTVNILRYRTPFVDANNWDAALQAAINKIKTIALAAGRAHGLPKIMVPGGVYGCSNTVDLPIWIEIVSEGSVEFDFSLVDVDGFKIHNEFSPSLATLLKFPAAMSACLNGRNGTISLLGSGRTNSTKCSMKIGNTAAGFAPCRDARVACIVASGWNVAQQFEKFDTYLCSTYSFRFEQNQTNIKTRSGVGTNSGERMSWTDGTIAGSDFGFDHNVSSFDAAFHNVSFDFNGMPIRFGATSSYCTLKLDNCYLEAWDGLAIDGTAIVASGGEVAVMITDISGLPRNGSGASGVNSPSRILYNGNFSLSISGMRMKYEKRPYLEDGCVVGPLVRMIGARGVHRSVWNGAVTNSNFINRDWDLQLDAVGTATSAMTAWSVFATSGITSSALDTFDGKKVLKVVSAGSSNLTLNSTQAVPCRAGDVLLANCAFQFAAGATVSSLQMLVEFYDAAGVIINTLPSNANYDVAAALADTTLPNFSSGNARWMASEANRAIAPKNTVSAKLRAFINNPNGTIYFSRFRLWPEQF